MSEGNPPRTRVRPLSLALLATLLGGAMGCGEVIVERGLSYDDRFGKQTVMNVYRPDDGAPLHPGVLMIHGGGWRSGGRWHLRELSRQLAREGYVTANIEYRLAPKNTYPAAVQDALCALSFFRSQSERFALDPDRVAALGYSAGGHLASLIGVAADLPAIQPDCAAGPTEAPVAVVSGAGVHEFDTALTRDTFVVENFLGVGAAEDPERWAEASPITHVDGDAPPFLFVVGTADPLNGQQRRMHEALLAAGGDSRLLVVPGSGHMSHPGGGYGDRTFGQSIESAEGTLAIFDFLGEVLAQP